MMIIIKISKEIFATIHRNFLHSFKYYISQKFLYLQFSKANFFIEPVYY